MKIPSGAKVGIVLLVVGVSFLFLFSVGKKLLTALGFLDNQGDKDKKAQDAKTLADIDNEIKSETDDLTYSESVYSGYVSKITHALDNVFLDDQDAVRDVFHQMKNRRDVLELVKLFGIQASSYSMISQGFSGGIVLWLNTGNTPLNDLVGDVNKILSDSKINYKF